MRGLTQTKMDRGVQEGWLDESVATMLRDSGEFSVWSLFSVDTVKAAQIMSVLAAGLHTRPAFLNEGWE